MKSTRDPAQPVLDLRLPLDGLHQIPKPGGACALEDDDFPFEQISDVAEMESWRKEINRPATHIHKWWAQRLGTVFRAIVLGALSPRGTDLLEAFYRPARVHDCTVFDPFMGSGTTVAEAIKLGARAIGRDINPVACFLVRNALSIHNRREILAEFKRIEADVADRIRSYYKTTMPDGQKADVLYFFWVKTAPCPSCGHEVDLFRSRIFARHSDPKRHPASRATCPGCGSVNTVRHDDVDARCGECGTHFNPQKGAANGQKATCPSCELDFPIAGTIRDTNKPPSHRLYAKLILMPNGAREYAAVTDEDVALFSSAEAQLSSCPEAPYPVVAIDPGYNTNQALGYNYRYWHEMFNARQLLCLSILAARIRKISDSTLRNLFTCLFSGTLEFNNMFSSFKGEGTGAVRHMFAHHILKPERTPLEAHPWGTRKSSGSFMTMFEGRIRRALDYAEDPFELRLTNDRGRKGSRKIYGLSEPLGSGIAESYADFLRGKSVYLSCGHSGETDVADNSVDAIITDPPFFDNVHYSQLADFFHVWQRYILGETGTHRAHTTRSASEVQNSNVAAFTDQLSTIWAEAHRVLKDDGLLVFTYHHSRGEGWRSMLSALMNAGFVITAVHPVKAEMSVAMPKHRAREPIDLDIIIVSRKRAAFRQKSWNVDVWETLRLAAFEQVRRLRQSGRRLSRNDVRVIVMAQLIRNLSLSHDVEKALAIIDFSGEKIETAISELHGKDAQKEGN